MRPGGQPAPRGQRPAFSAQGELRCDCGSLLARLLAGELELKCRRCKRVVTLEVSPESAVGTPVMLAGLATLRCTCGDGTP